MRLQIGMSEPNIVRGEEKMNKEEEVSRKERESHEINHGKGSYKTNNYGPII